MPKSCRGINIQYPISELILNGIKTIETRKYPAPNWLINQEIILIETPGKKGNFKQRMVAKIIFGESFMYPSRASFYKDFARHQVDTNSPWAWESKTPKWGWPVLKIKVFRQPIPMQRRGGIVYAKDLTLPNKLIYK